VNTPSLRCAGREERGRSASEERSGPDKSHQRNCESREGADDGLPGHFMPLQGYRKRRCSNASNSFSKRAAVADTTEGQGPDRPSAHKTALAWGSRSIPAEDLPERATYPAGSRAWRPASVSATRARRAWGHRSPAGLQSGLDTQADLASPPTPPGYAPGEHPHAGCEAWPRR
jgi:hypothetical protein